MHELIRVHTLEIIPRKKNSDLKKFHNLLISTKRSCWEALCRQAEIPNRRKHIRSDNTRQIVSRESKQQLKSPATPD